MKLRSLYEGKTIQFSPDAKAFIDKSMSLIAKRLNTDDHMWVAQNIHNATHYPIEELRIWAANHYKKSKKIPIHQIFSELLIKTDIDIGEQYGDKRTVSLFLSNLKGNHAFRSVGQAATVSDKADRATKRIHIFIDQFEKPTDLSEIRYVLTHELAHVVDPKCGVDKRDLPWKRTKHTSDYSYVDDPIEIDPLIKQYAMWYIDRGIEYLMGDGSTWEEAIDALRHRNIASLKGMLGFKPAARIRHWREKNKPVFRKFMREVFNYIESLK